MTLHFRYVTKYGRWSLEWGNAQGVAHRAPRVVSVYNLLRCLTNVRTFAVFAHLGKSLCSSHSLDRCRTSHRGVRKRTIAVYNQV